MSNPYPKTAVPLGPFFSAPGIDGVSIQVQAVSTVRSEIAAANALATQLFNAAGASWTVNALRNQGLGLALPDKPVAPLAQVVNTWQDPASSAANPTPVYVWLTDGDPVGVLADIPPLPPKPPAGNVAIGVHLFANYWQALPSDTAPAGTVATATASDGTSGTFTKVTDPFGGWWLKS